MNRGQSPISFNYMVELYNQLPNNSAYLIWQQRLVSDGECFLMKSCWFSDVKCNMKAEGANTEGGGGWTRGALGVRWRRCWGGDLIGDGLWYCY